MNKNLVLAAMVFAVAMTFIDQTIVAIAIPKISERAVALGDRLAVGHQRLSALAVGAVRVRRQARRRARSPAHGRRRRDRIRGRLRVLRADARRAASRKSWIIFFRVVQGATAALMFPAAVGDRRRLVPAARARQGDGDLLRHLRRADRDRSDRRRLPDAVDVARDLLDQHPGRDHRADPDLAVAARGRAPPGEARLPRHRADHRGDGPDRARACSSRACGAGAAPRPGPA